MNAPAQVPAEQVKAVRAFNRFYTQRIGVLRRYLDSDFTLTEVRVLYELAHRPECTATQLGKDLSLDAGYLSRLLRRFEERGWITREPAAHDGRQSIVRMTRTGYAAFAPLQQKSRDEAAEMLARVSAPARARVIEAMSTLRDLLEPPAGEAAASAKAVQSAPAARRQVVLRDPGPGDMGWVVQAHGEIYAREYRFGPLFEAMVADLVASYIRKFDPATDRGWIAEVDGERAGSVFVVRRSATVAQLRMLILTPRARGLGLGNRLVEECIAFARSRGYRKIMLWTNGHLDAARHIYASHGFQCVKSEPMHAGYHPGRVTSEIWELKL